MICWLLPYADNRRMDEWVPLELFDLSTVQLELVEEDAGNGR